MEPAIVAMRHGLLTMAYRGCHLTSSREQMLCYVKKLSNALHATWYNIHIGMKTIIFKSPTIVGLQHYIIMFDVIMVLY